MQKDMACYFLSILSMVFIGCKKEPIPEPEPPITPKLNILWQKPVSHDTLEYYINVHAAHAGSVLYCTNLSSPTATIQLRNGENGNLNWIFNSFESSVSSFNLFSDLFISEDHVIIEDNGDIYCIDYNGGGRLWYDKGTHSPLGSNKIGDNLYTIKTTGDYPNTTSSSLVRTKVQNSFSGWDTLYTRFSVIDSFPAFNIPVLWLNPQGDSILIFEDVDIYNGPPPTAGRFKSHLTAFNLRTREIEWRYPDFKGYYLAPPIIDGNRLYINGPDVFCFDLNTGQLLWQKAFEGGVGGTSLVIHNDILVVQSTQVGMWGVNKYTGDQIWYNKDTDGTTWELILFDGIVYCTSSGYGRLYAVNAETGATIWKEFSPNASHTKTRNASFADAGVAIDPERRLLYTADGFYIMCIKLPEK